MSIRVSFFSKFKYFLRRALGNPWTKTGVLLILTIVIYHSVIRELYFSWFNNHYYYHGFLIPLISVYLIFHNRKKLKEASIKPSFNGLVLFFASIFLFFLGRYFNINLFSLFICMLIFIIGGVLFTYGREYLKILLFPVLYLLFMVPIPDSIFNFLIGPLQVTAAKLGEIILQVLGFPVYREGIYLHLAPITIEVDKSCSAMHSLIALSALSVIVAYVIVNSFGKTIIIVASSIPIAILANAFRLVLLILLILWMGEEVLDSFFHPLSGKLFFLGALSVLVLEASIIKRIARPFATMNSFPKRSTPLGEE